MNYFECSVINGAGGSGSKVIVTCDAAFAGTTISCTKGILVYTQTCPSTSPYQVTFEGLENGTWTISGTAGGQVWSSEVIVEDITVDLIYGFDWRKWLVEGRVAQTFESLDDILEDEPTLRQLMLVHDAVDYLAETTVITEDVTKIFNTDLAAKWINNSDYALDHFYAVADIKTVMDAADKYGYGEWVITDDTTTPPTWGPKGNVPVMTANNAPYGEVSASVTGSGSAPYYVFDGNPSTKWFAQSTTYSASRLVCKFTNPICIKEFSFVGNIDSPYLSPTAIQIQGSNTGNVNNDAEWTNIDTQITDIPADTNEHRYKLDNDEYYLYIAVYCYPRQYAVDRNYYSQFSSLQFYGRELKDTPLMNADVTASGEAIASTEYGTGNEAYKAFDYSTTTLWASGSSDKSNAWIGYKFKYPVKCNAFRLATYSGRTFATVYVEGSNDEEIWETLNGGSAINVTGAQISSGGTASAFFTFTNDNKYTCYRLRTATQVSSSYNCNVYYLDFFAPDYSEKEFEVGTTKKWLYDHGVELETLTITGTGTKNDDYIQLTTANAQASATIDTTDYSLMRGKVGAHASGTNQLLCGSGSSNFTASNMPYNNGFDISSINGSNAVGVKQTAVGVFDATEIWLE